jgi:hypothetical protein
MDHDPAEELDVRTRDDLGTIDASLVPYVRFIRGPKGETRRLTVALRDGSFVEIVGTPPSRDGENDLPPGLLVHATYLPPTRHPRLTFPPVMLGVEEITIRSDSIIEYAVGCYLTAHAVAIGALLGSGPLAWIPFIPISDWVGQQLGTIPEKDMQALIAALVRVLPGG